MSFAVIIENFSFPTTTPSVCFFLIFSSKFITYTLNRIGLIGYLLILSLSRTLLQIFYSSPLLYFSFLYMFPLFFFLAVLLFLFFSASLLIFLCPFCQPQPLFLIPFVFFFLYLPCPPCLLSISVLCLIIYLRNQYSSSLFLYSYLFSLFSFYIYLRTSIFFSPLLSILSFPLLFFMFLFLSYYALY